MASSSANTIPQPPVARRDEDSVVWAGVAPPGWNSKIPRQSETSKEALLDPPVAIPDPYGWVGGSSGGSIADSILSILPARVDDFAKAFIRQNSSGISLMRTPSSYLESADEKSFHHLTSKLSICATRCKDGQVTSFSPIDKQHLLACVEASCSIPPSFHPVDIFSTNPISFPDEGSVSIEGECYVVGGIAAPAPPTPREMHRVVVSPISGSADICPHDPFRFFSIEARGGFRVNASFQNLRALRAACGLTSSSELQSYYDMGQTDAGLFLQREII